MVDGPRKIAKQLVAKVESKVAKDIGNTTKMPALVRKLLIYATAQGLLLQPLTARNQKSNSLPLQIEYKSHAVSSALQSREEDEAGDGLESHGVLGFLSLASKSYLISISHREQVAQIKGKPIFVITGVDFIPLVSQSEAQSSIDAAHKALVKRRTAKTTDTDTDDETDDGSVTGTDDEHDTLPPTPAHEAPGTIGGKKGLGPLSKGTSVAADVIKDRGKYGRFAERWFSKNGWSANAGAKQGISNTSEEDLSREQKRQGLSSLPDEESGNKQDAPKELQDAVDDKKEEEGQPDGLVDEAQSKVEETVATSIVETLTPRILKTLRIWLTSRSFYYSYEHDLSRRLATQESSSSTLPLFRRFDPKYFWNQHLLEPLINSDQHAFVLPVIQGFVGQRAFTIGKTPKDENDKIVDAVSEPGEVIELWERAVPQPAIAAGQTSTKTGPTNSDADAKEFLLTMISRRSIKRAGLRYLRRGVDDEGNVANNVETEQLLSSPTWDADEKTFSFTQLRGSIPLFFSQSPYSFKPMPITYGSEATNHLAFNKHFNNLISTYGNIQIASLVDKHATEKAIGQSYQDHVDMTNEGVYPSSGFPGPSSSSDLKSALPTSNSKSNPRQLAFTWFDFHHECRAFNFQNVSYLLDVLSQSLTSQHWTEALSSRITTSQSGVIRTNCMDCLDRTNVVQSAIAGHVLTQQLATYGLTIDLSTDPKTQWFNTLWADNGDAISRQYAGTAALKGDYTRTRKRNWTGAINDFSLTLGRYYNNIFGDYFLQTTIDYVLGYGDEGMWEEFESELMTDDHALDMRRVRQEAVERCVRVVLGRGAEAGDLAGDDSPDPSPTSAADGKSTQQVSPSAVSPDSPHSAPASAGPISDLKNKVKKTRSRDYEEEDLISGWTLHTPSQPNTLKSQPLEECVLLLTDSALYAVRFDWHTEKVGSYERVALEDIVGVRRGVYITSTLGTKNTDEERNRGFVVSYKQKAGGRRVMTRSLTSEVGSGGKVAGGAEALDESRGKGERKAEEGTEQKDFASSTPSDAQAILDDTKDEKGTETGTGKAESGEKEGETKLLAFKALAPRSTAVTHPRSGSKLSRKKGNDSVEEMSEGDVVGLVTDEVYKQILLTRKAGGKSATGGALGDVKAKVGKALGDKGASAAGAGGNTEEGGNGKEMWTVQDEDIISIAEARKSTGYFESIGYSLRRLVWA